MAGSALGVGPAVGSGADFGNATGDALDDAVGAGAAASATEGDAVAPDPERAATNSASAKTGTTAAMIHTQRALRFGGS